MLSVEAGLRDLWNAALWEGSELSQNGDQLYFGPPDKGDAFFWYACQMRSEAAQIGLLATFYDVPADTSNIGHLFAAQVRVLRGGRRRFETKKLSKAILRRLADTLQTLENSYLSDFLDIPISGGRVELTMRQLIQALWVLDTLTASMETSVSRGYIRSYRDASEYSFRIPKGRCLKILEECLGVEPEQATALFAQLLLDPDNTTKCFNEGVWLHPIIELDDDEVVLVRPSIAVGSKVRFVERTLTELLGNDLSGSDSFGGNFERKVRTSVSEALKDNELISDFCVLPHALKREEENGEEIDLLLRIGAVVLVCELKCLLVPTEPIDRYNLQKKLEEAAEQASRKLLGRKNSKTIEKCLGAVNDAERLQVLPLVVLNHKIGPGLTIDDVVITDQNMLNLFLGSGSYNSGVAIHKGKKAISSSQLYKSQSEAERALLQILSEPPPLKSFLKAEHWVSFGFPVSDRELQVMKPSLKPDALGDDEMISTAALLSN
ncbi:hypothetical protein EBB79_03070 [Parasedimentitalea marina]|uniref:NERD domain-containing protein n=2 Tax=Parasedimentitalea marina TaxID=2483033 RepID=A0A3T0MYZ6_9RHOB|nr:hypothetical protein EBB79_03070 [Parasedimentitalea marina]